MSQIHITREHPFSIDEAKMRLEVLRTRLKEKAGINSEWEGDQLLINGRGAHGAISLEAQAIVISLKLGLLLTPLKHMIEEKIHQGLDDAISRS